MHNQDSSRQKGRWYYIYIQCAFSHPPEIIPILPAGAGVRGAGEVGSL